MESSAPATPATPATFAARCRAALRRRPWIPDAMIALAACALGAVSRPGFSLATGPQTVYTAVVLGCGVAVVLRRIRPRAALTGMALLLVVHAVAVPEPGVFAAVICLIAAATTQTQLVPPWRWAFLAVLYAGAVLTMLVSPFPSLGLDGRGRLTVIVAVLALLTVAVLIGVVRRHRRTRLALALDRAAVLEAQQETERRLATIEERTRIAREMHDVLGHALTAIAVQAEGVRYILRSDADRADRVLADIGGLSRRAVDEVHDLIDVLAEGSAGQDARPAPSLRDLSELIGSLEHTRAIRLRVDGDLEAVPETVSLAGYRIVQESLTNALKHADAATIAVRVGVGDQQVDLTVLSTGRRDRHRGAPSARRGIAGMQERARALGGRLEAGVDPIGGGWRVSAVLPWSRA
ncbi:sensor histidine kinase [Brachybacterium hainanense]|uniref:histidine kinase n=1 Tax=Brachybacterium hainanense TaxID=1541174 RepID=A0ABV6RD51_9MICO